jgi:hypothetical protein
MDDGTNWRALQLTATLGVPGPESPRSDMPAQAAAHFKGFSNPAPWSGTTLSMSSAAELPRGTVTFLFTDIEGSTRLLKQLRDHYEKALDEHQRILRAAFDEHGGREIDTQGDSFFVAFPRAKDAVAAAVEAQRALAEQRWPAGRNSASNACARQPSAVPPYLTPTSFTRANTTTRAGLCVGRAASRARTASQKRRPRRLLAGRRHGRSEVPAVAQGLKVSRRWSTPSTRRILSRSSVKSIPRDRA